MNIYGKFGWNLFSGFREEELNVKSWRTDGRWTLTHDKSSPGLWPMARWTKKNNISLTLIYMN
jgi:hypothetical protein